MLKDSLTQIISSRSSLNVYLVLLLSSWWHRNAVLCRTFCPPRALSHKLESLSSLKDKPASMWLKAKAALEDEKDTMWSSNEIECIEWAWLEHVFGWCLQEAIGRQKKGLPQRGGLGLLKFLSNRLLASYLASYLSLSSWMRLNTGQFVTHHKQLANPFHVEAHFCSASLCLRRWNPRCSLAFWFHTTWSLCQSLLHMYENRMSL